MRHKRAILYEILFALEKEPHKITRLVYIVNAPPGRLKQYLVELRKRELVERIDGTEANYALTQKGKEFCSAYRQLTSTIP